MLGVLHHTHKVLEAQRFTADAQATDMAEIALAQYAGSAAPTYGRKHMNVAGNKQARPDHGGR